MSSSKSTGAVPEDRQADIERSLAPVVELPAQGPSNLLIFAGAIVLGLLVFFSLGKTNHAPSGRLMHSVTDVQEAVPPLVAPDQPETEASAQPAPPAPVSEPSPPMVLSLPQNAPAVSRVSEPPSPQGSLSEPPLVIDIAPQGEQPSSGTKDASTPASQEVSATRISNPSSTVAQGTLIKAVLETPIDSTRPGFARAIISRDVLSFDRKNVVIPRGTRAIGEYQSDATPGQKRALIVWSQLILPDGTMIALASPAADPLGGTGVAGKVNSHFFQRFGGAILQSILTIGVNVASESNNSSVAVALPGAVAQAGQAAVPAADVKPTIEVKEGALISIFVARNLNFATAVAQR